MYGIQPGDSHIHDTCGCFGSGLKKTRPFRFLLLESQLSGPISCDIAMLSLRDPISRDTF